MRKQVQKGQIMRRLARNATVFGFVISLIVLGGPTYRAAAYEYDESDSTLGAGAQAPWRVEAQWDSVDETGTREIHVHTTDPRYLTPLVSYIPEDPNVPSPRDVLGYISGTEGKLTRPVDEIRYFEALAAATPRVRLLEMGPTEEGRKMHLVIVTSEANMGRLDEYKGYTRALADPRNVSPAEAREIVAKAKPIMHITAGLHSPETGPPEMVMELAYRVAVSQHPDIQAIRDNVVLLITPITDVDGRAKVVDWYYRYLQDYDNRDYMPYMSPPYWGKYVYHDNNRDGIQMSQMLTQNYMNAFLDWHPTYSLDLHESVPLLYVSGGTGPYNRNVDPITIREWQLLAHYELAELQKHNLPGVWTWGFYTGWNPSYLLWITNNHNSMGRFYETFGNSSARTMERDLSDASYAGKPLTSQQWYRADPPDEKVVWSLRNNTNYMQSGVLASLKFLSQNGEILLDNFYRKGQNSIRNGKEKAPHAWVIPADQASKDRLAYLLNQLRRHAIEVHRATQDFEVEEGEFKAGDFVVLLNQPYGPHAKNLLEPQDFPKDAEHRPYDDVAWTLGLIYRVDTKQIDDKAIFDVPGLEPVTSAVAFAGSVGGEDPEAYAVRNTGQNSLVRARYLLERYDVLAAEEAFEAGGESYPIGSWIIPHRRGLRGQLQQVAAETMLDFHPLEEMPDVPTHEIDLPRIALYHNWVSTQNDGWVRFTLEQAGVPFDYISDYTVRRGNLDNQYDVILIAHQGGFGSLKAMVHGRDPKFGEQSYRQTNDFPSHGYVDSARDITGGFGFEGLQRFEEFLNDGGTLILMGSAGQLAAQSGLLRNVSGSGGGISTPGSVIQTKVVRRDHPIAYGYDDVNHVFRVNGPVYNVPEEFDHWIVVQYGTKPLREDEDEEAAAEETPGAQSGEETAEATEVSEETDTEESKEEKKSQGGKFLLSGYVGGQSSLEKKAVVLDVPRNAGGRVILYSFNPMHRYLNHGDHNYIWNAILHWNDFPEPEPKDHPGLAKD